MLLRCALVGSMLFASACSSSETSTPTTDSGAVAETAAADTAVVDTGVAETAAEVGSTDCVIKRVANKADCAENCDVRLLLPAGDSYCTVQCTKTSDCTPYGAGLVCSPEVGTCMPACAADASCTSVGFKRCDVDAGACDTI